MEEVRANNPVKGFRIFANYPGEGSPFEFVIVADFYAVVAAGEEGEEYYWFYLENSEHNKLVASVRAFDSVNVRQNTHGS